MSSAQEDVDRIIADALKGNVSGTRAPSPPPRVKSRHKSGTATRRATGTTEKPRTSSARKPSPPATDYTEPLRGFGQLVSAPLFVAGVATKRTDLLADSSAVAMHTPAIAEAVNDLAQNDPRVAALLDRIIAVGPYGAILAATLPLAAQIATNHKPELLSVTKNFGAVDPILLLPEPLDQNASPNGTAGTAAA